MSLWSNIRRIPLKYRLAVIATSILMFTIGYLETLTLRLDPITRGRILRMQIVVFIQCMLSLLSYFVWRNIHDLLDTPAKSTKSKDKSSVNNQAPVNNFTSHMWRSAIIIYLLLAHSCYLTNVFLVRTEPKTFTILSFFMLGFHIQMATGLFAMKSLSIFCYWRNIKFPITQKKACAIVISYALVMSFWGFHNAYFQPHVIKRVTIPVQDLPENLEGMKMALIPDIHAGPMHGKTDVENLVHRVNDLHPDVVMIVGDLVDGLVSDLKEAVEPLRKLDSKYGTYFVTGNHEYYTMDVDNWMNYLPKLGIRVLRNEQVMFPNLSQGEGTDEGQICLAGVDDLEASRISFKDHGFKPEQALSKCPQDKPVVLLAHQPKSAKKALGTSFRVDLVLSGHTHGGQMFPLVIGAYLINPFYVGLYKVGRTSHVYVSQGAYYWGIPMRTFTNKEISIITLERGPEVATAPKKQRKFHGQTMNFNKQKSKTVESEKHIYE